MNYIQTILDRFSARATHEGARRAEEEAARLRVERANAEYLGEAYGDVPRISPEIEKS